MREYHARKRQEAIELLGGACVRCGIDDPRVLQIDHVNGGGWKHHARRGSMGVVRDVITKNGKGFQLLCANCNWIKRYEEGENPQRLYVEPDMENGEDIVQSCSEKAGEN